MKIMHYITLYNNINKQICIPHRPLSPSVFHQLNPLHLLSPIACHLLASTRKSNKRNSSDLFMFFCNKLYLHRQWRRPRWFACAGLRVPVTLPPALSFPSFVLFLNAFVSNNAGPPTFLQGFGCTKLVAVGGFCLALIR